MRELVSKDSTVFLVRVTEYERGWGSRPEGTLIFRSEEDRTQFLADMVKENSDPVVPDYYWAYSPLPVAHVLKEDAFLIRWPKSTILTTWL
jgi:hypothetical protein